MARPLLSETAVDREAGVKFDTPDEETADIASEILAYFAERPHAQDTLEGVAGWWLLRQRIESRTAQVKAALDELVKEGYIVERRGGDRRTRYAVDRRRLEEIRGLLAGSSKP